MSSSIDDDSMVSWITWFCSLPPNQYLVQVPEFFIEDDFNLVGLSSTVKHYEDALDTILDLESAASETASTSSAMKPPESEIEQAAQELFYLIHARFIISKQGLAYFASKMAAAEFGVCPRYYCSRSPVTPCGTSDQIGLDSVKLFCPRCLDIYDPPEPQFKNLDGAAFELCPPLKTNGEIKIPLTVPGLSGLRDSTNEQGNNVDNQQSDNTATSNNATSSGGKTVGDWGVYVPRIFGFNISIFAPIIGQKMAWLRWKRPQSFPNSAQSSFSSTMNQNIK